MKKLSLAIFQEDCCGCHACEVACKQEHRVVSGCGFVRVLEKSPRFVPVYCHHCAKAPCVEACPVKALYRDEKGLVLVEEKECIGCRECVGACPFGAMGFSEEKEVAAKCDLCRARLQEGKAPACALVCPTGCILWGDSTAELLKAKKSTAKNL
jgi:formate dehydrogenase iron-sulfur subunit